MSIVKKILFSLLSLALIVTILLGGVSLYGFQNIKVTFQNQNKEAIDKLYQQNVTEITNSSANLAISLASYYAQTINIDFDRIMGELNTIKGDIETLYNQGGTRVPAQINRHQEYIISEAADINEQQVETVLGQLSAVTPIFDNILAIEPKISLAYLVLENGMVISSTNTFYPEVEKADMRTRDWYKNTMTAGRLSWSDLYTGTDSRSYITCSTPIYGEEHKIIGVVAFDLRVSEISEKALNIENDSFLSSFIINRKGQVLLGSLDTGEVEEAFSYEKIIENIDLESVESGQYLDDHSIIGYSQIESTNWLLVTVLNYETMMAPVENIAKSVSRTGEIMEKVIVEETRQAFLVFVAVTVILLILVLMIATFLSKSITRPIDILSSGAKTIGQGNLDYTFDIQGKDEISMLATTFNTMTIRLKEYISQVESAAAQKQRLESELGVARDIQLGMLPKEVEGPGYEVTGMMLPAKAVGGDFYDFFLLDEDKLCFVVADVSGKGVGAALFMTIAKMIIKTVAKARDTPVDELLNIANDLLCQENPADLFVTTYVGIMEIKTGKVSYACAGHNPPIIIRKNGKTEFIPIKAKLPLAAMEGIKYPMMSIKMEEGDTILLYTDGVTEATDKDEALYGDRRLLEAVKELKERPIHDMVSDVKAGVDLFVGEAPQFDDIAIVAIRKTSSTQETPSPL